MSRLTGLCVAGAAGIILCVSGCASSTNYSDLESGENTEPTSQTIEATQDHVREDSLAFVGDHEGTAVWLGVPVEDAGGICLVLEVSNSTPVIGCGPTNVSVDEFEVVPDGMDPMMPGQYISENVVVYD